jgi:uncharacterized protein (TIGR03437 family)
MNRTLSFWPGRFLCPRNSRTLCVGLVMAVIVLAALPASAANMVVGATSLSFAAVQGANPAPQSFYAYPDTAGTSFNPTVTASTNSGGNWITLSLANGASLDTTLQVIVQVSSQNLGPGLYTGQVTLAQAGLGGSPATVAVSFQVFAPGTVNYAVTPSVINATTAVGANASSQTILIATVGGATVQPLVTANTNSGGSWLALSATSSYTFNTTSTVQVNFNTASLPAGFYTASITFNGASVQNTPITIPVNLSVGATSAGPTLAVTPASVGFTAAAGQNPAPATLAISNSGQGTISPTLTTVTSTGGSWLDVTSAPGSGATGGAVVATVTANVTGLAVGTYTGTVLITDGGSSNSPLLVPVTLTIQTAAPVLAVNTNSLTLEAAVGLQASGTVNVTNTGVGGLNFIAAPTTTSGGNWLTVTPTSGAAPATLTITANTTGLAVGVYSGNVQVSIPNAPSGSQSPQNIAVTFAVGVPAINSGGIVNGASFTSQLVSAGEIVTAFGMDLGPTPSQQPGAVNGFLQTAAGGTSVTFDGTPGPLYYVSANQVNLQVPFQVAGKASTTVLLSYNGQTSPPYVLNLRAVDPAVFIANGRMAILNAAGAQITASNPAHAGDVLSIYATGLGSVSAQCTGTQCTAITIATGQLAPLTPLFTTTSTTTVSVNGLGALVSFAGLAPTFCGLYQVNFTVPTGLTPGDQPLTLSIGGVASAPLPLAVH